MKAGDHDGPLAWRIGPEQAGLRLDQAVTTLLDGPSRARIQQWIDAGRVRVDGAPQAPRFRLKAGQTVELDLPEPTPVIADAPETIALDPLYEDADLLVVNKPVGLVVHPGAGNRAGTLVNALLHFDPALAALPRAGIVHRLDKDTSGLLVIARNATAHARLTAALKDRLIRREYLALVRGPVVAGATIDAPLGRHPRDRLRQAVVPEGTGREAVTHYRLAERFRAHTLLEVRLETGRTHQIRVHLAHVGLPIVGDRVYGGRVQVPAGASAALRDALVGFRRQALHAWRLSLRHPGDGREVDFEAPLPADIAGLLGLLRTDRADL
ncbi:MAG: 23S rRNA pseudouridine(1911/1915/1917) synthase RluD [Chromatiales bacterium]|nr:23S rRNA pseudouridine(1911/1915/1917) synthase RluD [Chromatiales bacterium]